MTAQAGPDYFELTDYTGVLRRRWLSIAALAIVGLVLAGAYYFVTPKTYTASVLVEVNPLPPALNSLGGHVGGGLSMDNEAQLVKSAAVVNIAAAQTRSTLSASNITVTAPPNTTFLQIACTQPTAGQAQRCANALGSAYLLHRRVSSLSLLTGGINALQAQANALQTQLQQLNIKLGKGPGSLPKHSVIRALTKLQLTEKTARLESLLKLINVVSPLRASLAAPSTIVGTVVTPANLPGRASSPRALLWLPTGLAVGLIAGLFVAFYRDRKDRRLHSARDLERIVDLPTVFILNEVRQVPSGTLAAPWSKAGQSFTELGQYAAAVLGDGPHALVVVGTAESGSGLVARNLAAALARTRGETVLLTRGASGSSLADVLTGAASPRDAGIRPADTPRLQVIGTGLDASGGHVDLQYDRLASFFANLRESARYVVIEVQSAEQDAAAFSLAEFADGAVLVVQVGTSRTDVIMSSALRLEHLRTPLLAGAVLPAGRLSSGRVAAQPKATRQSYARSGSPQPSGSAQSAPVVPSQAGEDWRSSPKGRTRRADGAEPVHPAHPSAGS